MPMDMALVSVTRNGAWRDENIRSALWYSAHTPVVFQCCSSSWSRSGQRQGVLHDVVRVAGGDVEAFGQLVVVHRGPAVGDARGDKLVTARVLPDDAGLPADELGRLAGLERPPGDVVLGLGVAVRGPQVRPGGEAVRPVDQAPFAIEGIDVAVGGAQLVHESLEDAVVVQQFVAGLVVHLEPDDRGVTGVPADDLPDDPLGVEPEARVGEVDLLPRAPSDALPGGPLAR